MLLGNVLVTCSHGYVTASVTEPLVLHVDPGNV